ncbi:hypothetical protein QQZ08_011693 [Neonectria magnoliae]|uniref:BZIP domain-containing protein n=1 Tax=Neonectria magnoliae TaxID=2732573 RepID=A0ABR1H8H8_9HYPO
MSLHRPRSKEPPANKSAKLRTPESLALNRENQRRSRARHRDLLDDLQRRVREYERRDAQASLEMQRVARGVAAENAALRALLAAKGVADGEVEAHLRGVGETRGQGQRQGQRRAILPSPSPVARRGEVTLEPLREALLDPRLDMPHPMQSSPLVSVPGSSPIAPNCSQPSLPEDCLPSMSIPPLNRDVHERGPHQHLHERPELATAVPKGCRRRESNTRMDVDQRGAEVSQPGSEHLSTGRSKPQSTCQPAPDHQQQPQDPSAPQPPNKMRCVEAAAILARLRGNPDDGNSWAALGCSGSNDCTVRNTDLLQLMDEMT